MAITSPYAIDLETSEVTILSTPEFEGEIFSVSEDLRYHLFNSGSHITADDVDEDQNDYDTWVCRTGEGVLGCSLMDSDLAETQFDIARYIFKNGVRLIARTEIKDNTLFSE